MDSNKLDNNTFHCENIWTHFSHSEIWENYRDYNYNTTKLDTQNIWFKFIVHLNIGIKCLKWTTDYYQITDERKWLLTKIKYGF
jgi:hypothetical protein